ncbi:MAG TPA: DUF3343 domain-containing protein [bacterium]|nr:DUF3343 domain-containing protein [bacterium]
MGAEVSALIITFESSHMAIRAERALKVLGITVDLIPVPRQISSACGFCLIVPSATIMAHGIDPIRAQTEPGRESLWSVCEHGQTTGTRKEKHYERIQ